MITIQVIDEFVRKLKGHFGNRIKSIILFGSHARGESNDESDIDILIVGDLMLDEVVDVAYPIFLKYGVYISPIVMSRDYFEMLKAERTGFIKNVLREGVVLYDKA